MFLIDETTVVYSASDLTAAAVCEWATMRRLDVKLGRVAAIEIEDDAMLVRTGALGDLHERAVLAGLKTDRRVVEIDRPERPVDVRQAAALTSAAFASGAEVVFQAAFFDGRFLGYADFIIRDEHGVYEVYDTKLARHAKITALLQLAAYSDQLMRLGIPIGERVHLWLGTGEVSSHRLRDILPVYRQRRSRLERLIDERLPATSAIEWGDDRYRACGRCEVCLAEIEAHDDVLQVAGLRLTQRVRLRAAGIETIGELARSDRPVEGIGLSTLATLRDQARIQLDSRDDSRAVAWRVVDPDVLAAIPMPDEGDLFFDFEGDPLYQEGSAWGLDYLFGIVDTAEQFTSFLAHTLADERRALVDFLDFVASRRASHPAMHIYHYASYERTHLQSIAARHGVGEEEVADLLRDNVLVDLYPIVRRGVLIGSHSYSLKKLEPLYMGEDEREGVANAADSISEYVRSRDLLETGDIDGARSVVDDILRYNRYDCMSTRRLRDWLLARAAEHPVARVTGPVPEPERSERQPDPLYEELTALTGGADPADRTPDQTAIALAAAALDYHRRENNSFWWEHFDRLRQPIDEWDDTRNVFRVADAGAHITRDWSVLGRDSTYSRDLELHGTFAPGSSVDSGVDGAFLVYDSYAPGESIPELGQRFANGRTRILEADGMSSILVREKVATGAEVIPALPIALTPAPPPRSATQAAAIRGWAERVGLAWPSMVVDPALDLLRRRPPRTTAPLHDGARDLAGTIERAVLGLDHSYLAIQGPPGTGKTRIGSHVIAALVRDHGWKVGVVAQSHAVVEHMLDAIVDAGLDPSLVGKRLKASATARSTGARAWTTLTDKSADRFTSKDAFVIGGTTWTFTNENRIPQHSLDLLVIDEAGQYSLANTIASSVCAQRLMLLGDPQQLPQVTQGKHPEPVDESALGWLCQGHDVLPPEFGYFLDTSWRMHPAVCAPVSRLSYEGKLTSHESDRRLLGVEPGLHPVPQLHAGNATSSREEAATVVELTRGLLGARWTSAGESGPLDQNNIIVVAPYNAQVELIRRALDDAGFDAVAVGTVDRFQGREAAVSIISLAASSAAEVPRGLDFLLLANRLNVAISRAQWASYLLYSPALTETLPTSIAGLTQLSAFIELVDPAL